MTETRRVGKEWDVGVMVVRRGMVAEKWRGAQNRETIAREAGRESGGGFATRMRGAIRRTDDLDLDREIVRGDTDTVDDMKAQDLVLDQEIDDENREVATGSVTMTAKGVTDIETVMIVRGVAKDITDDGREAEVDRDHRTKGGGIVVIDEGSPMLRI